MKSTRRTYHTGIILLYATGKEHLLSKEFQASIPDSNKSDWRNHLPEKFTGYEYIKDLFEDGVGQRELYLQYSHLQKVHYAMTKIYIRLSDDLELFKHGFYRIKATRKKIVEAIEYGSQFIIRV